MAEFDLLAEHYDETRGGESRGDEYADEIDRLLPPDAGTVLEIGLGTGVVALGLARRGRDVVGLDISAPMLARAKERLGSRVVLSDALEMSIATASVNHAVSVWVVHSVSDPARLFHEVARVLRPGGSYVVCSTQRPAADDVVGQIIKEMGERVDACLHASRPRGVSVSEVLDWASQAGFIGTVHELELEWRAAPSNELGAIAKRSWRAMRELDEAALEEVTRPAIEALRALPNTETTRRSSTDVIVFQHLIGD